MAVTSKTNLKEYFNKGDKPTEAQFVDLIDSFMHAESSEFVNITSSGVISSSKADGEFSLLIHSASFNYISASTGDFDANTIRIGGTPFNKSDLEETFFVLFLPTLFNLGGAISSTIFFLILFLNPFLLFFYLFF